MKTTLLRKEDAVNDWYIANADGKVLGRLASAIAMRLMGKHKPIYTPTVDCGDFIVVVNVEKIRTTGNKLLTKQYRFYTGYPGGGYYLGLKERMIKHPDRVLRDAVKRMLPKTKLGDHMLGKLKIYVGPDHPHSAQQPKPIDLP
ncbi:MAG: 50S ribosomal protein L13 [Candidatus Brocadiia bacterium]